jgi:hypothetical protein
VDEVLAEMVLSREAHRTDLAVHPGREPAVREDPATQPVASLEDGDPVPGFQQQHPGGQARHPGADDDHVAGLAWAPRQARAEGRQQVDACRQAVGSSHLGVRQKS